MLAGRVEEFDAFDPEPASAFHKMNKMKIEGNISVTRSPTNVNSMIASDRAATAIVKAQCKRNVVAQIPVVKKS
jgi:hypothetical protein